MEKDNKSIEIRSEKVRNIIGQVPPVLVRNGTFSICIVLIILLTITLFIPYREIIPIKIRVKTIPDAYFFHASKNGYFVPNSTLSQVEITRNSVIGYIFNNDTVETIRSPINGDIQMNVKDKEYVEEGKILFLVIPQYYTYFGFTEISAEDINRLKKRDRISMKLYNGKTIEGFIDKIDIIPNKENSYEIKITFKDNLLKENLVPGSIYGGQIILNDISMLKKIMVSVGIK